MYRQSSNGDTDMSTTFKTFKDLKAHSDAEALKRTRPSNQLGLLKKAN